LFLFSFHLFCFPLAFGIATCGDKPWQAFAMAREAVQISISWPELSPLMEEEENGREKAFIRHGRV